MAALYDGDGNRIFKVEKKSTSYEEDIAGHNDFTQSNQSEQKPKEMDTYQGVVTWDKVIENITKTFVRRDTKTTTTKTTRSKLQEGTQTAEANQAENSEDTNIDSKSYAPTTEIEEEKIYVDPTTNFFWYGFGQGIVQGFSGAPQYLSAWFHDSWDYITNQYYIVRHIKTTEYKVKDLAETEVQENEGSNPKIMDSTQTSVSQSDPAITNGIVVEIDREKQSEEENSLVPDEGQEELTGYEQVLYDTVLIPSGTTEISRDNYVMTSYVNDVNQEYTQVLMEYDVNNEAASVYDYGVQRNSYTNQRSGASQTQYYLYDGQGSVSSLTSVYGNPLVTYQYDAYGVAQVSGETYSPYQYNAEAVDTNTGLQYLRARYYNSSIGSFITQDTYAGTLEDPLTQNLYTYTGNNPINYVDPSGHRYDDSGRNTGKSVQNPFSKRDRAPKKTVKTTAGIEDVFPTPGGKNLRNLSKPTNRTVKTTAGITDYINLPSAIDTYVDPVTQRLQNMYGDVTKKTPAYAYAGGKYVTALTEIERKMCDLGKNVNTKTKNVMTNLPEPLKDVLFFLAGYSDRVLSNLLPGEINNKPYQETYQVSYSNGQLWGDIVSMAAGVLTTVLGGTIATIGGLGDLLGGAEALTGVGVPAGVATIAISTEVIAGGVAVAAYGISVSMTASSNLGEDIRKVIDKEETNKNVEDILKDAEETTRKAGKARNFEKSGGYEQALKDFEDLGPVSKKKIETKYGDGMYGKLSDGTTISVRPGSKTGGSTLEIKVPGKKLIKIRY